MHSGGLRRGALAACAMHGRRQTPSVVLIPDPVPLCVQDTAPVPHSSSFSSIASLTSLPALARSSTSARHQVPPAASRHRRLPTLVSLLGRQAQCPLPASCIGFGSTAGVGFADSPAPACCRRAAMTRCPPPPAYDPPAAGGWCQVAVKTMPVGSLVIGVDLVTIKPIRGVHCLLGDITTQKCRAAILKQAGGSKMDVVLHDGAPNVGGAWATEAYSQSWLVLEALRMATDVLAPKGTFVTKIFRCGADKHWGEGCVVVSGQGQAGAGGGMDSASTPLLRSPNTPTRIAASAATPAPPAGPRTTRRCSTPSSSSLPRWRRPSPPPRAAHPPRSLSCARATRRPPRSTRACWTRGTCSRRSPSRPSPRGPMPSSRPRSSRRASGACVHACVLKGGGEMWGMGVAM